MSLPKILYKSPLSKSRIQQDMNQDTQLYGFSFPVENVPSSFVSEGSHQPSQVSVLWSDKYENNFYFDYPDSHQKQTYSSSKTERQQVRQIEPQKVEQKKRGPKKVQNAGQFKNFLQKILPELGLESRLGLKGLNNKLQIFQDEQHQNEQHKRMCDLLKEKGVSWITKSKIKFQRKKLYLSALYNFIPQFVNRRVENISFNKRSS